MKKRFKAIALYIVVVSSGVIALNSCVTDPDSPGLEYTPDMYRSPALEPYVDYAEFGGKEYPEMRLKQSSLRPPHNTVPYQGTDENKVKLMLPYNRLASSSAAMTHGLFSRDGWRLSSDEDVDAEYNASKADKNPIVLTEDNKDAIFDRGKKIYSQMCTHCHGEKGDGNGTMVESGAYAGVPDYANLKDLADGQVFYSIYYGKGAMGAHSMMIDKEEIWTLVHYVNKFRFDDYEDLDKKDEENDETEEDTEESEEEETDNSEEE